METKVNVSGNEGTGDAENKGSTGKTYTEAEFKGLLSDKQSEVRKRQELEQQVAEFKAQPDPSGGNSGTGDRTGPEVSDGDKPMTVSQFKELLAEDRKAEADRSFAALDADSTAAAKQKFTADAQGDGLDYDSVVAAGLANLSEGDKLAIRQSKNPAAERYRRCIFNTPELSEKAEGFRTSKLLENVKLKGRVPGSGSTAGDTGGNADVSSMSQDDLDKLAAELD